MPALEGWQGSSTEVAAAASQLPATHSALSADLRNMTSTKNVVHSLDRLLFPVDDGLEKTQDGNALELCRCQL